MNHPTPTRHGAWRVIDGQLVDENATDQITPALDHAPTPPIDGKAATEASLGDQAGPAEPRSTQRRKAPSKPR